MIIVVIIIIIIIIIINIIIIIFVHPRSVHAPGLVCGCSLTLQSHSYLRWIFMKLCEHIIIGDQKHNKVLSTGFVY